MKKIFLAASFLITLSDRSLMASGSGVWIDPFNGEWEAVDLNGDGKEDRIKWKTPKGKNYTFRVDRIGGDGVTAKRWNFIIDRDRCTLYVSHIMASWSYIARAENIHQIRPELDPKK